MTGIGGCRSTGAFSGDSLLFTGSGKLISITGMSFVTGGPVDNSAYVVLHDCLTAGAANAANTIGVLYVGTTATAGNFVEADMHGVTFKNGIFAEVTHVAGTATKFLVTFN
ncbi:MAG: hypothetical protein GOVbin556_81 [Prokaryotic dsDNA virus sp.]|nr:MAG: hypothetical protein GOVbin556_81 [Prokaryotic dsDNA virus sp.]|tara:strand:- start:5002 stop:5334 length:333 start_codon:yes stop_codon:yes gene_type:complete